MWFSVWLFLVYQMNCHFISNYKRNRHSLQKMKHITYYICKLRNVPNCCPKCTKLLFTKTLLYCCQQCVTVVLICIDYYCVWTSSCLQITYIYLWFSLFMFFTHLLLNCFFLIMHTQNSMPWWLPMFLHLLFWFYLWLALMIMFRFYVVKYQSFPLCFQFGIHVFSNKIPTILKCFTF